MSASAARGALLGAGLAVWAAASGVGCAADDGSLRLLGTVERTLVELVAPVSEVIVEIGAVRGARVAPGDMIVRLDPTLAEAELARAEAQLASARTARVVAAHELERTRKLRSRGVASEQELERAELQRDEGAARYREAQARLAATSKRYADLVLASPVHGILDQLPFDPGERVPAGAALAVILADQDPWVRVWIPQAWRAGIGPGRAARIEIDGVERSLEGSVLDVSREPEFTPHYALTERDRVHLVYEARVRIHDPPEGLPAGLPAEVFLDVAEPSGGDVAEPGGP